jgi:hypothetical protein
MSPKKGTIIVSKEHTATGKHMHDQSQSEFSFDTTSRNKMTLAQAHQKTLEEKKVVKKSHKLLEKGTASQEDEHA